MNRAKALSQAIVVALLVTLLAACGTPEPTYTPRPTPTLRPTATYDYSIMEQCVDSLSIGLEGDLPEALTVQVTDPSNMSCTLYFAKAQEIKYRRKFREYSIASPEFREVSQNLPPDSLCESGASRYIAAGYIRRDGSLDSLRVCCFEMPELELAQRILRYAGRGYSARGAIGSISFDWYTPARLTLTFYLPDRTMTTTVTPDYHTFRVGSGQPCKSGGVTIDLEDQKE